MPPALSLEEVKRAAREDSTYQQLIEAVQAGLKPKQLHLAQYTIVWQELTVVEGLLMRG